MTMEMEVEHQYERIFGERIGITGRWLKVGWIRVTKMASWWPKIHASLGFCQEGTAQPGITFPCPPHLGGATQVVLPFKHKRKWCVLLRVQSEWETFMVFCLIYHPKREKFQGPGGRWRHSERSLCSWITTQKITYWKLRTENTDTVLYMSET